MTLYPSGSEVDRFVRSAGAPGYRPGKLRKEALGISLFGQKSLSVGYRRAPLAVIGD